MLTPKVQSEAASRPTAVPPELHREHSRGLSVLSTFSLGDLFRDGAKSVKYPEKLLKVLEQKLQDIAMGRDPACVS